MSLDEQVKKLQQLIQDRSRLNLDIETSFSQLLNTVQYDPSIRTRSDIVVLYHTHRLNNTRKQESLNKCNRDIESLLKTTVRGGSQDDKINKMTDVNPITQAIDNSNSRPRLLTEDELLWHQEELFNREYWRNV